MIKEVIAGRGLPNAIEDEPFAVGAAIHDPHFLELGVLMKDDLVNRVVQNIIRGQVVRDPIDRGF